jgi:hypothetical protein
MAGLIGQKLKPESTECEDNVLTKEPRRLGVARQWGQLNIDEIYYLYYY